MEKVLKISVMLSAIDRMSRVVDSGVNNGIKSLKRLEKESDKISQSAFNFGRNAAGFGLALAAPLGMAVNAAADLEQMQVALKTSFQGNEEAANKAFKTINDFASKTPYELEEVMTGFIKLKNMGLDPSIESLTAYGNTASGMGKSLNDMVEAVADAATGEFERLKEFGIRASKQGEIVTFTFQGVKTSVKMNSEQIELYLKKIGLTKFAGGIEAQSKTFKGQMSTMKDNVKMFGASIGKMLIPVLNDLFKKVTPILEKVQKWIERNPTLTRQIIMATAAIAALSLGASALAFIFGGLIKIVRIATSVVRILTQVVRYGTMAVRFFGQVIQFGTKVLSTFRGMILGAIGNISTMTIRTRIATIAQRAHSLAVQFGTKVFGGLRMAITFVGQALRIMGAIAKANPIILIISLIIGLVFLLIDAWDDVVGFFKWLWDSVKKPFVDFWNWIKGSIDIPVSMIKNSWNKIVGFFKWLWAAVKKPFVDFWNWVTGLGARFTQAGANLVNSIWNGVKGAWNNFVQWWKDAWKTVREYLPFSPAKRGPLKDIHRIRLIETIAENVKHEPITKAMDHVTKKVRTMVPKQTGLAGMNIGAGGLAFGGGVGGRGGGSVVVNFSPNVTVNGGGPGAKQDFLAMLKEFEPDLMRVIKDAMAREGRKQFS